MGERENEVIAMECPGTPGDPEGQSVVILDNPCVRQATEMCISQNHYFDFWHTAFIQEITILHTSLITI